jgi:hypothetical protein
VSQAAVSRGNRPAESSGPLASSTRPGSSCATGPTAVYAHSDEVALGAVRTLRRAGLRVPGDISVVGIDDHPVAELTDLTTVAQPVRDQGELAARMPVAAGRRDGGEGHHGPHPPGDPRFYRSAPQVQADGGATAGLGADGHPAAVGADDGLDDRQAQTRTAEVAAPAGLGTQKRSNSRGRSAAAIPEPSSMTSARTPASW